MTCRSYRSEKFYNLLTINIVLLRSTIRYALTVAPG